MLEIQYRTVSIENDVTVDFWYMGDNHRYYSSFEDAFENSETIKDWQEGGTGLTVVRLLDLDTGHYTYVSPHVPNQTSI